MRILLDECVPRRLKQEFPGHDVVTVPEIGRSGKKNGELLRLLPGEGFEVLITVDQNIRHQQLKSGWNWHDGLIAATNRLADLIPLMPSARAALASIKPGDVIEITV